MRKNENSRNNSTHQNINNVGEENQNTKWPSQKSIKKLFSLRYEGIFLGYCFTCTYYGSKA